MGSDFIKIVTVIVLTLTCFACSNSISDSADYYAYLEDSDNGITKTKESGDVAIKVKFLPAEYLCYQEIKMDTYSDGLRDSILEYYKYNLSFLVTIGPSSNTEHDFDITKVGISDYSEFRERAKVLNFGMVNYFTLKVDNKEYKPTFCEMENVYGLTYERKFNIVFAPKTKKNELITANKIVLEYEDELFNTGINKFTFKQDNIKKIPKIAFWNHN